MSLELDDLREDGTARALVDKLDRVLIGLGSVAGTSAELGRVIDAYVLWADAAAAELGAVLSIATVEDWVYDDRHWRLREMPTDPQLPARDYLRRDLERRRRELTELRDRSKAAADRWVNTGDLVVLDTNLLLDVLGKENGSPDDVDWNQEINSRTDICLVIPLAVLQELDKLKRHNNKDVRSRAHSAIRWLDRNLPADGRRVRLRAGTTSPDGVTAIRQFASLYGELYADRRAHHQSDTDLTIIESTQTLARLSGRRTVLATRDINMRIRATAYGAETKAITRLPVGEPD